MADCFEFRCFCSQNIHKYSNKPAKGCKQKNNYQEDKRRSGLATVDSISTVSCIVKAKLFLFKFSGRKMDMVDLQNASLSGGVAVGAIADLMV